MAARGSIEPAPETRQARVRPGQSELPPELGLLEPPDDAELLEDELEPLEELELLDDESLPELDEPPDESLELLPESLDLLDELSLLAAESCAAFSRLRFFVP